MLRMGTCEAESCLVSPQSEGHISLEQLLRPQEEAIKWVIQLMGTAARVSWHKPPYEAVLQCTWRVMLIDLFMELYYITNWGQ